MAPRPAPTARGASQLPVAIRSGQPGRIRAALGGLWWYVRAVSGELAYDRYVDHAGRVHPDAPPISRRAFERARQDEREGRRPQRCC